MVIIRYDSSLPPKWQVLVVVTPRHKIEVTLNDQRTKYVTWVAVIVAAKMIQEKQEF